MSDETHRLLADLEALATSIADPARRDAVRRIIARLSDQGRDWPDEAELMRLRLEGNGSSTQRAAARKRFDWRRDYGFSMRA